jgi:hypothetical protein
MVTLILLVALLPAASSEQPPVVLVSYLEDPSNLPDRSICVYFDRLQSKHSPGDYSYEEAGSRIRNASQSGLGPLVRSARNPDNCPTGELRADWYVDAYNGVAARVRWTKDGPGVEKLRIYKGLANHKTEQIRLQYLFDLLARGSGGSELPSCGEDCKPYLESWLESAHPEAIAALQSLSAPGVRVFGGSSMGRAYYPWIVEAINSGTAMIPKDSGFEPCNDTFWHLTYSSQKKQGDRWLLSCGSVVLRLERIVGVWSFSHIPAEAACKRLRMGFNPLGGGAQLDYRTAVLYMDRDRVQITLEDPESASTEPVRSCHVDAKTRTADLFDPVPVGSMRLEVISAYRERGAQVSVESIAGMIRINRKRSYSGGELQCVEYDLTTELGYEFDFRYDGYHKKDKNPPSLKICRSDGQSHLAGFREERVTLLVPFRIAVDNPGSLHNGKPMAKTASSVAAPLGAVGGAAE